MELIPASVQALQRLAATTTDAEAILTAVRAAADAVVEAVPHCVGMSITLIEAGRSITLLATSTGVATLDAVQFIDGGPCEDSLAAGEQVVIDDLMSEDRWALFSRATAVAGVRSSLSLPLRSMGEVVGGVNLYADTTNAFDDTTREVATIFGAAVEEAVRNADLAMATRGRAERAADDLRRDAVVDQAVGVLIAQRGSGVEEARATLAEAAARAGISQVQAAEIIVQLRQTRQD